MFRGKTNATRRRLLQYIGATPFLTGLGMPHVRAAPHSGLTHAVSGSQESLSTSLRALGEAYLKAHPAERSKQALRAALENHPVSAARHMEDARETSYLPMIQDDFATENTVELQGWVLSRTEARLAALSIV